MCNKEVILLPQVRQLLEYGITKEELDEISSYIENNIMKWFDDDSTVATFNFKADHIMFKFFMGLSFSLEMSELMIDDTKNTESHLEHMRELISIVIYNQETKEFHLLTPTATLMENNATSFNVEFEKFLLKKRVPSVN